MIPLSICHHRGEKVIFGSDLRIIIGSPERMRKWIDKERELKHDKNPSRHCKKQGPQRLALTKESGRFLSWKNMGLGRKMAFQLVEGGELYA